MYLVCMKSRITLFLFFLAYILSFVDRQIVAVLGVQIREAFELGNLQIGLLYGTAFSVIYALAGIPMGWLADRFSRKWMIVIGVSVWSLMTVLSGIVTSFAFLIVARMMLGLSQAMLSPAVYSLLASQYSAAQRATIFSVYASGIFIGVGISFLVGGSIAEVFDWQTAMISVGWPGLLLAAVMAWVVVEPQREHRLSDLLSPRVQPLLAILKNRSVRLHFAGFSFLACTGYTLLAFLSTFFADVFQRSDLVPDFGWFFFGVAFMVILSGRVADRLACKGASRRYWMGILSAGALPVYVLGLWSTDPIWAFALLGVGVLIGSSYNGVATAILQSYVPDHQRGFITGLYLFVISIAGFGFGPPLAGWMMDSLFNADQGIQLSLTLLFTGCNVLAAIFLWRAKVCYDADALE